MILEEKSKAEDSFDYSVDEKISQWNVAIKAIHALWPCVPHNGIVFTSDVKFKIGCYDVWLKKDGTFTICDDIDA